MDNVAGRHARPPEKKNRRPGLRFAGLAVGVLVLALVAVAGGLATGVRVPWGPALDLAVASIVTPSPTNEGPDNPADQPAEPIVTPAYLGAEGARDYDADVPELSWDGDPAVVSSVYPGTVKGLYGVAIVIRIEFAYDVPEELKGLLERSAAVITSKPLGNASWSWYDDNTLAFRPEEFWPAYTDVKVDFSWKKRGFATVNPDVKFRIGRSQTFEVSANKLIGKVKRDGVTIRKVPVSLGKPTWETTSGIKAIMERYAVKRMVNPGPREPYDVNVPYALRITPSGEYLHAAPWNEHNLGLYSTSHGCTNVSYTDGMWFFERALEGDPVITTDTGLDVDPWEGPGALFNIDWATWTERSRALGSPVS